MRRLGVLFAGALALGAVVLAGTPEVSEGPPSGSRVVYRIWLTGEVNSVMASYVQRAVKEAEEAGAALIVCELNTPGGMLDAAWDISQRLVETKIPKVAWVNDHAASAGALLTLSCEKIVMSETSVFGSAVPVVLTPLGAEPIKERKYIDYMLKHMRQVAIAQGHDPDIAEAMVDERKEIRYEDYRAKMEARGIVLGPWPHPESRPAPSTVSVGGESDFGREYIVRSDEVLDLNADEAVFLKVAVGIADSLDGIFDLPEFLHLKGARIATVERSWSEGLAQFLANPLVSSLLLIGAIIGISTELKMPGFGAPGIIGIACLAALFFANFAAGAAEWTDLIIFLIGVILLGVELFLIPGFGAVGVIGIIMMVVGLFLMLMKNPPSDLPLPMAEIFRVMGFLSATIVAAAVLLVFLFKFVLPATPAFGKLVLLTTQQSKAGFNVSGTDTAVISAALVGRTGRARSTLRPAGKALFEGQLFDVVTQGEMVEAGEKIRIIEVSGNRIVVERAET